MKKFLAVALTMLVVSCTTYIPPAPKANYSYKQYPVQNLNVGSIQVVEAYSSPMKLPNVEHLMPDPLPHAVADWARTRFKANGGAGTLTITITNASVIRQDLPTHQGVTGWFNVDQSDRFEGKVDVNFSVDGVASGQSGTGAVNVARSPNIGRRHFG